ncbi:MAG TPA: HAMP domain-containing sensor histidine kinase [Solirubrobacteraceae bacterium]
MSGRPWLGAVGLRGRIAGAMLVTSVVALAVAAVVLLGPLENSLRSAGENTLKRQVPPSAKLAFKKYDPGLAYYADTYTCVRDCPSAASKAYRTGQQARAHLEAAARAIGFPIQATVALLGYPDAHGHPTVWVVSYPDFDLKTVDPAEDAATAFRTGQPQWMLGSINGVEYARAAIPFTTTSQVGTQHWVLIVRKSLSEVSSAVSAVRTAFLVAALVALALTLIIGVPLSARIVRRLRVLRQAAARLAIEGPSAKLEVPIDRDRDEVGDLARTFALMQRQLLHQEEARRAFVATASHELRTPLTTLDGMLELLDEDLKSGDPDLRDTQDLLERARAQSKRLGRLAADLLDLSRLDAEVVLRSEPLELGELSRAVLAEFELGTGYRNITTVLDDAPGPVWALGDPGSVAQIVRILMDNALRMSPDGSEVTVELRNGEVALLSVCDRGPGVPREERELIFQRFIRGRQTAGQSGFGLGLAIGRELAERMGGELVLEEHDGPGARFTLRLPVARAPQIEPLAVS